MSCNCNHEHEEHVYTPPTAEDVRKYSRDCKIQEVYDTIFEAAAKQENFVRLSPQPDFVIEHFRQHGFTVEQEYNQCDIQWEEV